MRELRYALMMLLLANGLDAQFLYDSARDAKGQEALKAAKDVTNGQVFDSMQSNVDRLSKSSSDRFFAGAERQMRSNLASFGTWRNVRDYVAKLDGRLRSDGPTDANPDEVRAAADRLKTEVREAESALAELKAEAKKQFDGKDDVDRIGGWFSRLGQLGEIETFAAKFTAVKGQVPSSFLDAATEASALTASLAKMYKNFEVSLGKTPDLIVLEAQVQLLQVNEDHLKQIALIILRREADLADTYSLIRRVNWQITYLTDAAGAAKSKACSTPGHFSNLDMTIVDSLRAAAAALKPPPKDPKSKSAPAPRDPAAAHCDLDAMVFVLYNASALAARDDSAKRLASLRMAEEERRYSIRASAVSARSYETLVSTGTQRLANYYKGGVKPETLAQFANALATFGLIPTIAVK